MSKDNSNYKEKRTPEDKAALFNKERALFLKELSKDPDQEIDQLADRLMIDPRKCWDHVRSFLVILAESSNEGDFQKLKAVVNTGVEPLYQVDETHINALTSLLPKYGDASLVAKYENNRLAMQEKLSKKVKQTNQVKPPAATVNNPLHSHETPIGPQGPTPGDPTVDIVPPDQQGSNIPPPQQHNMMDEIDQLNAPPSPIEQAQYTADDLNKGYDYSYLSKLNRIGLIRWAAKRISNPPWPQTVENFIQYFELNQDKLMVAPEVLHRELQSHFGERTGDNIAKLVKSFITWLKPSEQFGVRKMDPNMNASIGPGYGPQGGMGGMGYPQQQGAQFEDPFNTYYHHENVLPYGMNANSGSAKRLIWEYEREKKSESMNKKKRDELFEDIRMKVQMDMTNFLDKGKMGGNGHAANPMVETLQQMVPVMLIAQVVGGKMSMEPYTDPETGKTTMRMVPSMGGSDGGVDPDRLTARDMMEHMSNMYQLVDKKRDENTGLFQTIMGSLVDRLDKRGSVTSELVELHQLYKEIVPQQPALSPDKMMNQTADFARIMLEGKKFEADAKRTDDLMKYQWEQKGSLAKYDFEREQSNTEMRKTMIKSISQAIGTNIPTLFNIIMLLTGRDKSIPMSPGGGSGEASPMGGMGGGIGNIMNMVGKLFGGGGGGSNPFADLFGGGGGGNEEEEPEEDENYFKMPRRGSRSQRAVSQANPGFDINDLADMFGNTNNPQQQDQGDEYLPNMQFGPGQGGPRQRNFSPGPVNPPREEQVLRPPGAGSTYKNTDTYTGLYDEMSVPTSQPGVVPNPDSSYQSIFAGPPVEPQQQKPTMAHESTLTQTTVPDDNTFVIPNPAQEMIGTDPNEQIPNVPEEQDEYEIFTPERFNDYSDEQLDELEITGIKGAESARSYLDSVRQKKIERQSSKKVRKRRVQSPG